MPRWPMLDGLRGVAILLVLVDHVGLAGYGGPVGVTLFFVLSGFLITSLLLAEQEATGTIRLRDFYIRRGFRLLPALLAYVLGSALLAAVLGFSLDWIWGQTWPVIFYVANYAQELGAQMPLHWHTWSLAVEEHFYLLWPLAFGALSMHRRVRVLTLAVVVLAVWDLVAGRLFEGWGYAATDTNAYALGAGCLLALLFRQSPKPRSWYPAVGLLLLVALAAVANDQVRQPLVVLTSAFTVWACAPASDGLLAAPLLRGVGRISYALYLWHVPFLSAAATRGGRLVAVALAFVAASASWYLIEQPALAFRDRVWKRPGAVTSAVEIPTVIR